MIAAPPTGRDDEIDEDVGAELERRLGPDRWSSKHLEELW